MVYFHHFGTLTHTPAIAILARKRLQLRFLVLLAILSNHKTHHI